MFPESANMHPQSDLHSCLTVEDCEAVPSFLPALVLIPFRVPLEWSLVTSIS